MAVAGHGYFLCSICVAEVDSKHSFLALFSSARLKEDWPRCISKLFKVSETDEEGLPRHLCEICKAKALAVSGETAKVTHVWGMWEQWCSSRPFHPCANYLRQPESKTIGFIQLRRFVVWL